MADADAKPAAEAGGASMSAGGGPPATTTISTISLQSGDTRLVIALLQSKDMLQLKVLELTPEITLLGSTLAEALALQRQHEEVLQQLQSKQSPVEELLRQADQLIATQRPRAEVYAAMAESLGIAWKDVNSHLDLRKTILELNVAYHSRAEKCTERMILLATACRETELPVEFDAVRNALTRLHVLRRTMLEDLMVTLQDGKALHEKLKEMGEKGTLDSRPAHLIVAVSHTISQVEHWLEELHDRRQSLDLEWQSRKSQLEQCCALALSAKSLKEIEETLNARKEVLHRINDHLGDSASSAELLLHEHKKLTPEAKDFQDRCLKITRAAEVMMVCGHFAGKQATTQAYIVLNSCAEYINSVEQREVLLNRAISFFRSAQSALTKLDQLEIQLTTSDAFLPNLSLAQLHVQTVKSLEDITAAPLQEGYSLLESVGSSSPGVEGVKRAVNGIEDRKTKLASLCTAHEEENLHISKELTTFLETHNILHTWLVSIAEAFLQGHQDMGSVLAMAEDFLLLHQQLLSDLQNKGAEINEVLLTLPPILERLNDAQRLDIDGKVESLHSHWLNLKTLLEARIDLASLYVKFHTMAVELANEFDSIDMELKKGTNTMGEEGIRGVEQNWLHLQHLYGHLCNLGQSFIEEGSKCTDPYLDVKRASLSVQTLLEHFGSRQLVITESWQTWQMSIITEREFKVLWERNITESKRTLDVVSNLDVKLYPVLTGESTTSKILVKELEEKLQSLLPELKKAQTEIELRVKTAENLINKGDAQEQKESLVEELMEKHHRLNTMTTEYQILVQMFISFLTNLSELEKTIENLQSQYNVTRLPNASKDVELLMKEHEASKQAVLELFKFTQSESEQIIQRINQQEPEKAARHDIQRVTRLLEIKKMAWESAWTDRKLLLEQRYQLCQFDYGLEEINSSLSELSNQLLSLTNQIRDAEGNPRTTQCAYQNFEKTIQTLETKIETFATTTHHLYQTDQSAEHVDKELKQLKEKWLAFRNQAAESRRLIDLSTKYFKLVDEANVWYLECGRLFISVARRSTKITSPEEALILQSEVDDFLKIGRIQQEERVKEITIYALDLYGEEWSRQKIFGGSDYTELVDALATVSEELGSLATNLRIAREEFERRQKEMQETDATLAAAKAEAAAAKAAATAAEEARKAAEAASKALQQASLTINEVELVHIVSTAPETKSETEQLRKTPSPPCKKVKVMDNELPQSVAPVFTVPLKDASIQEGEQFTFECRVTGFPVPEIVWYKDSISIQNNPDYQTTYQEGICTLAIEETFTEDSAQFTCKAFNSAGTAETNAILSVKEAQPEEQLAAPTFSKIIESGSAKEGSTFHLKCIVEGNPLPTVQWYKNGTCIDNSSDYVITYNNGEAILKFEEVFLEDQAEYTCKASNPLGTDTCSARLTVDPLEPTEVPRFITPLSNVMARAGRKIKLECVVTGLPLPELLWSHNGKTARETRDLKLQYENGKGTLIINEAFPKDAGTYVVIAKNIAGEATCSCNVSVKGRLPTETSDSEIPSDFEPVKPSIQLALKDVSVIEGKQVQLDCIIVGQPEPEVIWYHNDRPVKESSDFQLLFQGDRCSLVIHEAYLEDTGEYKVVAINSGGEASSKCNLIVQSLGEAEPATRSQTGGLVELPLGTPPKFNSLLSEPTAQEGEKVVLECNVTGDPKPIIQWFFNDQKIVDEEKRKCYEDAEGNIRLTLHPVTLEDRGVYTAKASNEFGEAKSIGILIVKPSTLEEPKAPVPMEEKLIAPSFKELFADKIVNENEDARFECVVFGKPTPKVHWMFNNEPISGEDFLASTNGERQVLTVKKVQKFRCGDILCVAENDAGKASCAARLNLMEPIKAPDVSYSCATSATEKTESSSFVMKQTVFIKSSSQTSSMMLEGLEPKLQNHSVSSHSEQILLENGKKPATKSGGEDTDSTSCYSTPFSSPRPARKSVPPRFVSPLNGKIVDQGADVILEGIIDGYPQPTVTWTKNSQELLPGEKVSIKNDRNRVEVVINDVTVKDSGKYTCKAVNSVGSASSTADVVVRKTIFPPVFGRRLHAQTVKEGDRVVMEVEITGTPDPTVTWYKEGQKIVGSVPGQPFRTKEQVNSYSLIIEKATLEDSGQYSVKAVNSGGEAQCTADFIVVQLQPKIEIHRQEIHEDLIISTLEEMVSTVTPKLSRGASAHEESSSLPYPAKPEPVRKRTVCPPPPSPSKFVKGNFQESDHESDYDCRIPVKWKPTDSDADEPTYRPVRPVLTPKHHLQTCPTGGRTPTPPTEFDHPPEFGGPPRPKFEPIEKPSSTFKEDKCTVQSRKLFKPKPVTPRTVPPMEVIVATPAIKPKETITLTPGSPPEIGYAAPPRTKVKVSSFENATQIETSNVMNFAESTEHSHRVVNVQQTTRVIKFADKESKASDHNTWDVHKKSELQESRGKFPPPTHPKKFVPGEFRESDYESDIESVRIKPKWTPGNSDTDEPHYRKVKPPQVIHPDKFSESNTSSQVQSNHIHQAEQKRLQRVEEMRNKFDGIETVDSRGPPVSSLSQLPKSEDFKLQPGESPEFGYSGSKVSKDASYVASKHMKEMTNSFKSKAQQFVSDIMTDVSSTKPVVTPEKSKPQLTKTVDKKDGKDEDDPQAYREESRVAEYGTKHIDPDTGLIYFKYDFGYEFGIVLPGEAGKQVEGGTNKPQITPKRTDDIEVPVIHEKTASEGEDRGHKTITAENVSGPKKIPQFRPKKFTHFKSVKWEPASESEMSEAEGDVSHKKYYSLPQPSSAVQKEPHIHIPTSRWEPTSPSPLSLSLSPSLPSLSPHTGATIDSLASPGGSWQGLSPNKSPRVGHGRGTTPTPPSSPSTPGSTPGPSLHPLCKPPMFITPLRDIAVVKGQTARFECIVQAEPMPNILWTRDGRILENSDKHQIHFRNGVCRLTIPQAFHDDAGNYTCTATNMLGTIGTTGSLQVPGERCSLYK